MLLPTNSTTSHTATYADAAPSAADLAVPDCGGGESFALMVLGHSMAPEFLEGEIIIIEPDGLAQDGSYVLAWHNEEWTFRQLLRAGTGWVLHPLNPAFADVALDSLAAVRGVIIQKALPGRRRASKHYV
ncbi:S24 family peptidase [Rhodoferax sp.]|uniref:S24 family peptidase n=1 Tax=Rhodoferax sp. TaxID=50421 RepID=UPI00271B16F5|nr:S24 family peptidase [Rhodoferax sp.]MDO9196517.1 S24 family peptidase [Rhodoferax sp.]